MKAQNNAQNPAPSAVSFFDLGGDRKASMLRIVTISLSQDQEKPKTEEPILSFPLSAKDAEKKPETKTPSPVVFY